MGKILRSKKGFTLAEVVVAFALTGVLLASASAVLGVFMKTFVRVKSTVQAQTVAGTLMETMVGALESAADMEIGGLESAADVEIGEQAGALYLADDGSAWYTDYDRQVVHMYVDESGCLQMEYPSEIDGGENDFRSYPESFYNGCKIQRLEISKVEGRNLLEITLEVKHHVGDVTYSVTRLLECYNLEEGDIVEGSERLQTENER